MRNSLILFFAFTTIFTCLTKTVDAQLTLIPDPNFEQALINLGLDTGPINGSVPTANISGVTSLNIRQKNIFDLTGIQDFTALSILFCEENHLTSLDVTHNAALTSLNCGNYGAAGPNQLTSLDVTHNAALIQLTCGRNLITSIDVTHNTALTVLDVEDNKLTSLDVTQNIFLTDLYFQRNLITSINVTQNTALLRLAFDHNFVTNLDVTHNLSLTNLDCSSNLLPSLDVTLNTSLKFLLCGSNLLPSLDVTKNTALINLNCINNLLPTIDVTKNIALTYLGCDQNFLPSLDVTKNTALGSLGCSYNQLPSLDVTKNTALIYLFCGHNQLPNIDVTKNTVLQQLQCSYNQLPSLDVTKNIALLNLFCEYNQLSSLDVTKNTALTWLYSHHNQLTSLNLRNGSNPILATMNTVSNPNLNCIQVDNSVLSAGYAGWSKDATAHYDDYCIPTILSFTPSSGCTGQVVNIIGANLNVATGVSFGGVPASSFTILSASNITAVVGTGASGNIDVTTPGGTATIPGFIFNSLPTPASVNISSSTSTICTGANITFTAAPVNGGATPVYQWQVNGSTVGTNAPTYSSNSLANGDIVKVSMTSSLSCVTGSPATSNSITITVLSAVTPTVNIVASITSICSGTNVTFTATPTNGGTTPNYQWQVNGTNVGTNSSLFSTNILTNSDQIKCILTSNNPCVTVTTATSNIIQIVVNAPVIPSVSISASSNTICIGALVTFTATPVNGGTTPSYQWKSNGINVGFNSSTYSTNSIVNGDVISCILTNLNSCSPTTTANSNSITMIVTTTVFPSLTLTSSLNDICPSTPITFTATPLNVGTTPSFQWKLNGSNVGSNSLTYINNNLANGDKINCIMNTVTTCSSLPFVYSDTIVMIVKPIPIISFNPVNPIISLGSSVQLNATVTGNLASYLWTPSTGLNNPTILNPIANPVTTTIYNLNVIATNSCSADKKLTVTVFKDIYIPNSFTPNGDTKNDIFRIPPGTSLNLQYFIIYDRYGNEIFKTSDINTGWDGTYKGAKSPNGAYTYLIKGSDSKGEIFLNGTVLVIR